MTNRGISLALRKFHVRVLASGVGFFSLATAIYAQGVTADAVLGPNANVLLSIIAGLIALVCGLIAITYRAMVARLDTLEERMEWLARRHEQRHEHR